MKFKESIIHSIQQFGAIAKKIWLTKPRLASLILFSRILQSILPLGIIYSIKNLVDIIIAGNLRADALIPLIVQFAIIQLAIALTNQTSAYWENTFQQIVSDSFANRIIQKSIHIEYTHFEDPSFQNALYLAQQQAKYRINQLLPAVYGAISNFLSLVFLILLFLSLKAYFFMAIFILAVPMTINKWYQGKKTTDLEFTLAPKERESSYLFRILTGLPWAKELRTFQFGNMFQQEFLKIRASIAKAKKSIHLDFIKNNLIAELLEVLAISAAMLYLAYQSINNSISIGLFILYLQGIQRLQISSKTFLQSVLQIFQLRLFVRDLIEYFNLPEMPHNNRFAASLGFEKLEIQNLSFTYPNSLIPMLEHININARKGETIAIVGENGSGKSTLVKLIAGLYKPGLGTIKIDGKNIQDISKDEYYQKTAFLFQDYEKYYM
jgi:ATP-binding cassette subfamily B protein